MKHMNVQDKTDLLLYEIDSRRDDLISLTQDLIRIPTLNPPGENYREICEFLDQRLQKYGFSTDLLLQLAVVGHKIPLVVNYWAIKSMDAVHVI